jgi:hypothetical protein
MTPQSKDEAGWIDEPALLETILETWRSTQTSDRLLSRFYLQLRYARPSGDIISQTGLVQNVPAFVEGFVSAVRQVGYNSFLEVTDGCTAKICQALRPKVVPVAAKPNIARQCTLLSRVQDGVIDKSGFFEEARQAWEDAYCCPCGFVLFEISPQTKEIICHRVDPLLVYTLRGEGRHPIHLGMHEAVSRSTLIESYPQFADEINACPPWEPENIIGVDPPRGNAPDTVKVCRGWRRQIGDQPGRYVVTVGNTVLNGDPTLRKKAGQEWPYDFFPFSVFRNRWDHKGFCGIPMGRFIAPHHLAINRLARIIEDSLKGAVPVLLSHMDSGKNDTNDIPYQVWKWKGAVPPAIVPTNPVSQQALQRVEWHENKCYEIAGISRGLATGKTSPGITAGVALREVRSLADERASQYDANWTAGWEQAGHIIVALANEVKKIKVPSKANKDLMDEIDLTGIDLDRNDYKISYGVTSALSKTIPGLLADLNDFKDLGFIDQTDMAEAIGDKVPDIAAVMDRVTAARRLAAKQVQTAIEDAEIPIPPSAIQGQAGLDAIVILGQQAWCQAMINPERVTDAQLATLHRLIKCAQAKQGAPLPAVQPIMPAAPIPQGSTVPVGQPGAPAPVAPVAPASTPPTP